VSREFNYIVRIHGTNLDGTKTVPFALCDIRGVGIRVARSVITLAGVDPHQRLGNLSDSDVRKLEAAVEDPSSLGLPNWMLNRRKDHVTGEDTHLISSDLDLRIRDDIELMAETRSWKGDRHSRGLKVRGQRTKTTARKGRSVGVSRSRIRSQRS
jgi:small subunit ribosomal protein S13